MTLTEAFRKAGFRLTNRRNNWSAIDEERGRVALTVWTHQIDRMSEPWRVDVRDEAGEDWTRMPGNTVRRRHIEYGLEKCRGEFALILVRADDPDAATWTIKRADPWPARIGLIRAENFDPEMGTFAMDLVAAPATGS